MTPGQPSAGVWHFGNGAICWGMLSPFVCIRSLQFCKLLHSLSLSSLICQTESIVRLVRVMRMLTQAARAVCSTLCLQSCAAVNILNLLVIWLNKGLCVVISC